MRARTRALALALALGLLGLALAPAARAYWPGSPDPLPYVVVAGTWDEESWPVTVSDGTGGMLVFWGAGYGQVLRVQHLTATGAVDPAWPADGRLVTDHMVSPNTASAVSDGAGGAVVTWMDSRSGTNYDIFAHHVRADGTLDPAWPAVGVAVCTASSGRGSARLVADTQGGAIAVWEDSRSGNLDIYAQRVRASGVVDPAWPANGRALCTAANQQTFVVAVPDGSGGMIAAWSDYRSLTFFVYAQHVRITGVIDSAWPADGRRVSTSAYNQYLPAIASDGDGGALLAWSELRTGTADVYAQHVLASGAVDAAWPAEGRAVCTAANNQQDVRIVSDGAAGAIVGWLDHRGSPSMESAVYAQHVLAGGAIDPVWTANGVSLHGSGIYLQTTFTLLPDGLGGALATWAEGSGSGYDVWAHRVNATGTFGGTWGMTGVAVASGGGDQDLPGVTRDDLGGLLIAWTDDHDALSTDIRARRVDRWGQFSAEPRIDWIHDTPGDNGGWVTLRFHTSPLESTAAWPFDYVLWRQVPQSAAAAALACGKRVVADAEDPATRARGALLARPDGATTSYWEYVDEHLSDGTYTTIDIDLRTLCDSVAGGSNPLTAFMVEGRWTLEGAPHWFSEPVSGYSTDDLPPDGPSPLVATYVAGATTLHWSPSPWADRSHYHVYRDRDASDFPLTSDRLVGQTADTTFTDPLGLPCHYAVTTVDVHGNEGAPTRVPPAAPLGVDDALPRELSLAVPQPNPARGATTLRLALPAASHVRAGLYDAQGRRVRALLDGALPAGVHAVRFDGRDDHGASPPSGLYLFRFEIDGRVLTRRYVVVR